MNRIEQIIKERIAAYEKYGTEKDSQWIGPKTKRFVLIIENGNPYVWTDTEDLVRIYVNTGIIEDGIKSITVNWSAIGDTDPETARKFAEYLTEAAAYAEELTKIKKEIEEIIDKQIQKKYNL